MAKSKEEYSVFKPWRSSGWLADKLVGEGEGYEKKMEPADTELTQLSEGNVPISEAEYNTRIMRKKVAAEKDRILNGFWDTIQGGSQNVWDLVRYQGDVPDEVLKERAIEANEKLEALDAEKNQEELAQAILANRRPIEDVRAEMTQMISAYENRTMNDPEGIKHQDFMKALNDYLDHEKYTWRELQGGIDVDADLMPDPFGFGTSSPDPFPEGRIAGEIAGTIGGYATGLGTYGAIARKFGGGFKKGMMMGRGPFWARVAAGMVGGMIGIGSAEYGYELTLDTMNQAGMFGKKGINRPGQKERIRQAADIAEIDAKLTAVTAGFIPILQGFRNLSRWGLGSGKGVEGMESAIKGEKLMEKFAGIKYDPIVDITATTKFPGVAALPFTVGKFPIITGGIKGNMKDRAEKLNWILSNMVDRVGPSVSYSKLSHLVTKKMSVAGQKYQDELRRLFDDYWKKASSFDAEVIIGGHPAGLDVKGAAADIIRRYEAGLGVASDGTLIPTFKSKPLYNYLKNNFMRYEDVLTPNQIDQIMRVDLADLAKAAGDDGFAIHSLELLKGGLESAMSKMAIKGTGEGGEVAVKAAAQTKELMIAKKAFDDFYTEGQQLLGTKIPAAFGIKGLDKYGYQLKMVEVGPKYADQMLDSAKFLESPEAMRNFHSLVGDDIFRAALRRHIENAWMKSLKPFEGKTAIESHLKSFFLGNPDELMKTSREGMSAIGGATEAGERFVRKGQGINHYVDPDKFLRQLGLLDAHPRIMETMKYAFDSLGGSPYKPLSKLPSWAVNGADELIDAGADVATVNKVFNNGTTSSTVVDKLPSTKDFIDFAQVMSAAFKGGVPDISTFIARRAQISGLRGVIGAFLPGAKASASGAGVLAAPGMTKVLAFALMGRYGMKIFTNPINMKAFHKILDPSLPVTSKAWQSAAMIIGQNFRSELEDLDLTLAELEGRQKRKERNEGVNSRINNEAETLKGKTGTAWGDMKNKINEKIDKEQLQKKIFENLKPSGAVENQSALPSPTVQTTDVANVGGSPVAGSSLAGSNVLNPGASAALYTGNTDMALANQYGGGAFGQPTAPVQQMPRMAAKGGIISLVS